MPIPSRLVPVLLTTLAIAAVPAAHAETDAKARALIAAARLASGGDAWDRVLFWHEQGALSAGGLKGSYESWIDLARARTALSYTLGPSSGGQGWDGDAAWTVDSSKLVRVETSDQSLADARQNAYVSSYCLYFADRCPAEIAAAGERSADGASYDAIKVTPKGAEPIEIWFDRKTHLPEREVQLTGAQPATTLVSDWRPTAAGVTAPFHVIQRMGNDPKFDQVSDVGTIDFPASVAPTRFQAPPPPADDSIWPAGRTSVTVPFELYNNHIYVEASINGTKPAPFIFDTGAVNILDPDRVKDMGVKIEGALPGGGFGDQIGTVGLAKVKSVSIGGFELPDQTFAAIAQPGFHRVEDVGSAGLLGYEFVKRAVLSIDYAHRTMTFTKRSAFTAPAKATAIPFTFNEHVPMVTARIDGIEGEFEIDTGSRGALTIMHPFATAHHLVETLKATRHATVGYGVGGPSRALLARPGRFDLGPVALDRPVAELIDDAKGAAAETRTAGNIGGDLLKRFTLTLDYEHQRLWLEPNALAAEPDGFDRSGLWLMRAETGGLIEVADVAALSAAAKAGIKVGDRIAAVDGKPADAIRLPELRAKLMGPPGTKVTLTLAGDSAKRPVSFALEDQI